MAANKTYALREAELMLKIQELKAELKLLRVKEQVDASPELGVYYVETSETLVLSTQVLAASPEAAWEWVRKHGAPYEDIVSSDDFSLEAVYDDAGVLVRDKFLEAPGNNTDK